MLLHILWLLFLILYLFTYSFVGSVLQARGIGERIIAKMKEFVEVFFEGMMA